MQVYDSRLCPDPNRAIRFFAEWIDIGVGRIRPVAEREPQPIFGSGVAAVADVKALVGTAPDPAAAITPQEVRVGRPVALLGPEVGRHPAATPARETAEADRRAIADPDLIPGRRNRSHFDVEHSALRSDDLGAAGCGTARDAAFVPHPQ